MLSRRPILLALALLLGACSDDSTTTAAPPGKVTLRVSALLPVGGQPVREPFDAACVSLGADRLLGVELTIENYALRSPGICGDAVQCGYAQLTLLRASDGSTAVGPIATASTGVVLDLSGVAPLDGDYLVHPELLTTYGKPFTSNFEEEPVDLPVRITSGKCAESGAGGAGGAGAGGASGAGATDG
jgi:hypothetical protein